MRLLMRVVLLLGLLLPSLIPSPSALAQAGTSDIAIVTSYNGSPYYDACYILVGYGLEGCDENADGKITFEDVPYGSYTVQQTRDLGGLWVDDFSIYVSGNSDSDGWERFYASVIGSGGSSSSGTSDIAIVTDYNQSPYYDACYILVGYGNEGCDENRDGKITFEDVPLGTYTVQQTRDLGGHRVNDVTISVTGRADADGWERFYRSVLPPDRTSPRIGIFTEHNGQSFYDACYVLVDFSLEGCDDNHDGSVTFDDVPYGTYTVHQTRTLPNGLYVADFTITVRGYLPSSGVEFFRATVSSQTTSGTGTAASTTDIALITRDPADGHLLTGACYVLLGYSNEGCDENGDGQVTFDDIPFGRYTVHQTRTPNGYPTIRDYEIQVSPLPVEGMGGVVIPIRTGFIVKQATEQNAPNTRNVSLVFYRTNTLEPVATGICAELVGASNVGCDEDLIDGQIDFLDVPAGGPYEIRFTNVPAGYRRHHFRGHRTRLSTGRCPMHAETGPCCAPPCSMVRSLCVRRVTNGRRRL